MKKKQEPKTSATKSTAPAASPPSPLSYDHQRLVLHDGRVLDDAVIWHGFVQDQLGLEPDKIWEELLALPTWSRNRPIPFRQDGGRPHWIGGDHPALNYRGNEVKRDKIWCQSGYGDGLRRYRYTGWQHAISYATHAVEFVPPVYRNRAAEDVSYAAAARELAHAPGSSSSSLAAG